ncbi:endonuclease III [Lactobacillus sp. CC-MHH1034]|uniref:endonuclease III n=1 Tax=Agrilactobacillus fermenti TaxID=2586909 RepID=UPI001E595ABE|nr:endonuclease III [Agrilactobacillus fermenti]MCD2255848.1 endonuclease III [Agrilactobacillus fermenti]
MLSKAKTLWALEQMKLEFPNAQGALNWDTPFHLLMAVILSAQATDISVNKVAPALFDRFPDPASLASADLQEIESYIHSIGLYHNKAKHLKACAQQIIARFDGQVPQSHTDLESLPGVGRKTANVVLGDAFGIPGFAVDTHVARVSKRLQIVKKSASVQEVEQALTAKLPKGEWVIDHHTMILFGRYRCTARNPKCETCPLLSICAEGQRRVNTK